MTESRLYGATIAFECSKMKAKILELSKMALFQVDTDIKMFFFIHSSGIIPYLGSGDRFLILVYLVNIQYSGKGSNSSSEHVGNPVFDF